MRLLAAVLAPVVALAGCAGPLSNPLESDEDLDALAQERPIGPAHGVENEQVEYEVKLRGLTVGRVQIAVGARGVIDGRPAVIVRSRAIGAGLADVLGDFRWELTSTIDIDAGCATAEDEGVEIAMPSKRMHDTQKRTFALAPCRRSVHAAAGALRGWRSHLGSSATLDVAFDGGSVDVALTDAARETISTGIGPTPAVRYDGTIRGGRFSVSAWVSDDDARVPLKMTSGSKLGEIEITLVSYEVADAS